MKQKGSIKWQQATTTRRKKRAGEWVSNGDLYRAIDAGYNHFLASRIRAGALQKDER